LRNCTLADRLVPHDGGQVVHAPVPVVVAAPIAFVLEQCVVTTKRHGAGSLSLTFVAASFS
jgi:hypothetical protein